MIRKVSAILKVKIFTLPVVLVASFTSIAFAEPYAKCTLKGPRGIYSENEAFMTEGDCNLPYETRVPCWDMSGPKDGAANDQSPDLTLYTSESVYSPDNPVFRNLHVVINSTKEIADAGSYEECRRDWEGCLRYRVYKLSSPAGGSFTGFEQDVKMPVYGGRDRHGRVILKIVKVHVSCKGRLK